jgi:hypothetical protein
MRIPQRLDRSHSISPASVRVQLVLTPSTALSAKTPLEVLRSGDDRSIERLKQVAEHAGEMGDQGAEAPW